jgi:carbon monoxide dehydrogenase subunit G
MKIQNSFTVALPVAEAWTTLLDIPAIAPCMPGAELLAVEDERTYRGQVKVKLGPVAVAFQGRAKLEEVDEAARTVRVKASGNETKGRGSAQADVMFRLRPDGAGTRVDIVSDVALAGAVAQYGRAQGVIADVAQVIIDTFAENLRRQIAAREVPAAAAAATAPAGAAPAAPSLGPAPEPMAPAEAPALSVFAVLLGVIKRWFGRLTGAPQ